MIDDGGWTRDEGWWMVTDVRRMVGGGSWTMDDGRKWMMDDGRGTVVDM
jgi:hypothetical protein